MGNEENMAFNQNIAQEYNRNKILTASPAELTLMLYEGAIKFCNIALIAIEKGDLQKVHTNIKKAEDILNQALDEIRGMRDTWKEVMNRTRGMNQ